MFAFANWDKVLWQGGPRVALVLFCQFSGLVLSVLSGSVYVFGFGLFCSCILVVCVVRCTGPDKSDPGVILDSARRGEARLMMDRAGYLLAEYRLERRSRAGVRYLYMQFRSGLTQ